MDKNSKYLLVSAFLASGFSLSGADSANAQNLDLSLGQKNLPSIEINLDAIYEAKAAAEAKQTQQHVEEERIKSEVVEAPLSDLSRDAGKEAEREILEAEINTIQSSKQPEIKKSADGKSLPVPASMKNSIGSMKEEKAPAFAEDSSEEFPSERTAIEEALEAKQRTESDADRKAAALERATKLSKQMKANEKKRKAAELAAKKAKEEEKAAAAQAAAVVEPVVEENKSIPGVDAPIAPVTQNTEPEKPAMEIIEAEEPHQKKEDDIEVHEMVDLTEPEVKTNGEVEVDNEINNVEVNTHGDATENAIAEVQLIDPAHKEIPLAEEPKVETLTQSESGEVVMHIGGGSAQPSSGDSLSISSMFEPKDNAPLPSALQEGNVAPVEPTGEQPMTNAAVEAKEDGSLLPPKSLLPDSLNTKKDKVPAPAADKPASMTKTEPAPAPVKEEVASAPPTPPVTAPVSDTAVASGTISLEFKVDQTDLSPDVSGKLASIISQMKGDSSKRLSVIGYASNPDDPLSTARRVSLKRALAIRKQLIDSGIDSTRINVQAMGNEYKGQGNKDRVEIFFAGQS